MENTGLSEHLLAHDLIAIYHFVPDEVAIFLYDQFRSAEVIFNDSLVSDAKGDAYADSDTPYQQVLTQARISRTAFASRFPATVQKALNFIRQNAAKMIGGVQVSQFEPWQCTWYKSGGKFDYHEDCGNWASNERLYTVMLTIKAPDSGGQTHFNHIEKTVESQAGRMLIWRNLDSENRCNGRMMHAGLPVGDGSNPDDDKMILVTWIRRFDYGH